MGDEKFDIGDRVRITDNYSAYHGAVGSVITVNTENAAKPYVYQVGIVADGGIVSTWVEERFLAMLGSKNSMRHCGAP